MKEKLRRLKVTILKKDNELEEWRIRSARTIVMLPNIQEQLKLLIQEQQKHALKLLSTRAGGEMYNNPLQKYISKACNTWSS